MLNNNDIKRVAAQLHYLPLPKYKNQWKEVYQKMIIHTQGKLPTELIAQQFPNELSESRNFRLKNYRPITMGGINRAISRLHAFFHDSAYEAQLSDSLRNYLNSERFISESGESLSFWSFIDKYILRKMIEDPNGLLVWLPNMKREYLPNEPISVTPLIVPSSDIRYLDEGLIIITLSDTPLKSVYLALTHNAIYSFKNDYLNHGDATEIRLVYEHNLNKIPALTLGGEPAEGYYQSYFYPYVPFAEEAICQFSQHQATMVACGFPIREEAGVSCSAPGCRNGEVLDYDSGAVNTCESCHGTGKLILRSPLGVYIRPEANPTLGIPADNTPTVRFLAPDTHIIQEQKSSYKDYLREAEKAINVWFNEGNQSGYSKEIDRQEQAAMLTKIADNIFDNLMYESLWLIECYRNTTQPIPPVIFKPTEFKLETEQTLIDKVKELQNSGAPRPLINQTLRSLSERLLGTDEVSLKIIDTLMRFDPLFSEKHETIASLLVSGAITAQEVRTHHTAYKELLDIAKELGPAFLTVSYGTLSAELQHRLANSNKATEPLAKNTQWEVRD